MAEVHVVLPHPHPAQMEIILSRARFRVAACGRRFGKTSLGLGEALRVAAAGGRVWWVAPTYDVSRRAWLMALRSLHRVPRITVRQQQREIEFPGGGMLVFRSADAEASLLGEGLDFLVVDEAAIINGEIWERNLRPMLADRSGRALFLSTPRGHNWFWGLYLRGRDPDQPDWASWQFPTSSNPRIPESELREAQATLPERTFRQEFLAEFLADGGAVFRLPEDMVAERVPTEPRPGMTYVAGVDWGRAEDYTAIVVLERETGHVVAVERFNLIGWSLQRSRLLEMVRRWRCTTVMAEANSMGEPNIEALQAEGLPVIPFTTSAASKPPLIEALALALERRQLWLPQHEALLAELRAYTVERTRAGHYQYSAPAGMHDDLVMALALAWRAASLVGVGISFV